MNEDQEYLLSITDKIRSIQGNIFKLESDLNHFRELELIIDDDPLNSLVVSRSKSEIKEFINQTLIKISRQKESLRAKASSLIDLYSHCDESCFNES